MKRIIYLFIILTFANCDNNVESPEVKDLFQLINAKMGTIDLDPSQTVDLIPVDKGFVLTFSQPLDKASAENAIVLEDEDGVTVALSYAYLNNDHIIVGTPNAALKNNTEYVLRIDEVLSTNNKVFPGIEYRFKTENRSFSLVSATINDNNLMVNTRIQNIPVDFDIALTFSDPLSENTKYSDFINIRSLDLDFQLSTDKKNLNIRLKTNAVFLKEYLLIISQDFTSEAGFTIDRFTKSFYTQLDPEFKFPEISDDLLLTKVQEQTFKYFWDFGHPVSGLARERNTSGEIVTIGGSGFGVMTILVGIERNFISRQEGVDRLETIVNFLKIADRFHGVWPHWINGTSGKVIPFSSKDDGADLVETAFMIEGLLTIRQYLDDSNSQEATIKANITQLWEEVEWDWFTQGGQNELYWHWSPNVGWEMNHKIQGWNESLIVYVLAAASPTHPISADVYHQGWARNGDMANGKEFYDNILPLGDDRGGPLFFSHYSFLGLDPRNLEDQYANYWDQNVSHSLINQAYCEANPRNYIGYSAASWGLTASDNHTGYSAHSPNNDLGVITPTAAISSLPYTPVESMAAIRHFYYLMGDKLWGNYGFYDAFNVTENWYANSFLAIDQGPIILMIENHRTGLFWDLLMQDDEIVKGLVKLDFTSY
ncbi:MAG: Ig-like domain-containing protein [Reichenbachiella sp.]